MGVVADFDKIEAGRIFLHIDLACVVVVVQYLQLLAEDVGEDDGLVAVQVADDHHVGAGVRIDGEEGCLAILAHAGRSPAVHHGHTGEVEAGALEVGGVGVVDEMAVLVGGAVGGVDGAHHVHEAHVRDVVDVEVAVAVQLSQIKRGAPADHVLAGEVVQLGGIHAAAVVHLGGEWRVGDGREAVEVLAVGAHLHEGQLQEGVVEGVLEDGEVVALAIADGHAEGQRGLAAVSQTDCVSGAGAGGAGARALSAERGRCRVRGDVARTALDGAASGPAQDGGVVVRDGLAVGGAHDAVKDLGGGCRQGDGQDLGRPGVVVVLVCSAAALVTPLDEVAIGYLLRVIAQHG